jgi:large subunit ribosomal protein L35
MAAKGKTTKKAKTHKGAKKRFRLTATGKAKFHRAGKRHNLNSKSKKRKLKLSKPGYVFEGFQDEIRKAFPHGEY